ncbi:MAG: ATP-binding protein [Selenomonadaceae bacterium]
MTPEEKHKQDPSYRKIVAHGVGVVRAGLAIYRYDAPRMSILWVNDYMSKLMEVDRESLMDAGADVIMSAVSGADVHIAWELVKKLVAEDHAEADCELRLEGRTSRKIKWTHIRGLSERQDDGTFILYCVFTDITARRSAEDSYRLGVKMLLRANLSTIYAMHLNLTRNLCEERHIYVEELAYCETADECLKYITDSFEDDESTDELRQEFTREYLIKKFDNGQDTLSWVRRCYRSDKSIFWARISVRLLRNPITTDVEAIFYAEDYTNKYLEERVLASITTHDFETIGAIDVESQAISYYSMKQDADIYLSGVTNTLEEKINAICAGLKTAEERDNIREKLSIHSIVKRLQYTPVVTVSFEMLKRNQLMTFRYLDKYRTKIIFMRRDVTRMARRRKENVEMIQSALRAAQLANKNKTAFFGNVSHDLRTPLNAILGYDNLARRAIHDTEKLEGYLDKIKRAGETMLLLVNDTLDLQRLESGEVTIKPEPTNLTKFMGDIVNSIEPMVDEKKINLHFDAGDNSGIMVMMDPVRVRQIFVNLLSNATKYTPENGRIDFIIKRVPPINNVSSNTITEEITVRDNGIGMTEKFAHERLFEPFAQERNEKTRHIGGSGLGLSIVRKTVEMMAGRIAVESKLGEGTTFTVTLDLELAGETAADKAKKQKAVTTEDALIGFRILMCEDNSMNAEIATTVLEWCGARVDTEKNGVEGVKRFTDSPTGTYDVILMDLRMPIMDGFTATKNIRASSHTDAKTIPILALSADAYESDVKKSVEAGMNGHLSKPINPDELVTEIRRLVKRHKG